MRTPTQEFWAGRPALYRVYDASGRLIYIGASHNLPVRFRGHELNTWWYGLIAKVRIEVHPTREAALAAEAVAIQEEQPAFNIRGNGRDWSDLSPWTLDDFRYCKQWLHSGLYRRVPMAALPHLEEIA